MKFEEEALKFIARSGSGSLRDTLTLLDQAIIFSENYISTAKITEMLGFLDPSKIKEFYHAILHKDRERVFEFLEDLQDYEANSVIDEMLFYLKESFFARSEEFSTLIYERFFRILSRAKNLLCDDDGFTLCVMAFMMMEASYLKEIDMQISDIQSQIKEPLEQGKAKENIKIEKAIKSQTNQNAYELLLEKIYDRDYELAECFKQSTKFIAYENEVLIISSNAQGQNRTLLNQGFKLIQELLRENFGANAKIEVRKEVVIDESKLQSLKQNMSQNDLNSQFDELRKNAKKADPQGETKEALRQCFGDPQVE